MYNTMNSIVIASFLASSAVAFNATRQSAKLTTTISTSSTSSLSALEEELGAPPPFDFFAPTGLVEEDGDLVQLECQVLKDVGVVVVVRN
mmetsp:Transcript_57032/g.63764  ORF Transcript_57032/g.63764 Transcript_57032/m.63764 type:complete len:90 (+) Transcript_57032:114-383(+)